MRKTLASLAHFSSACDQRYLKLNGLTKGRDEGRFGWPLDFMWQPETIRRVVFYLSDSALFALVLLSSLVFICRSSSPLLPRSLSSPLPFVFSLRRPRSAAPCMRGRRPHEAQAMRRRRRAHHRQTSKLNESNSPLARPEISQVNTCTARPPRPLHTLACLAHSGSSLRTLFTSLSLRRLSCLLSFHLDRHTNGQCLACVGRST